MKVVQVLGPGCAKCKEAARVAEAAADEAAAKFGVEARVEKVTDMQKIMELGVFSTPAVAVDGQVKAVGRVPSQKDIVGWLED
ncbi:redox-active disulfide protein 2 [Desulfovibrio sp. X2]|uniref:thioredoxin family protein n=1 Tax=Desulfovibrio sp. X2 TaxID=941449 RepID=UPI000358A06C|nr:thioredoxin family protein [Desulfovibrio sp. X2]EPR37664.1 redox-active disulfide protein 2 [Desulfovibrio sp. X2]